MKGGRDARFVALALICALSAACGDGDGVGREKADRPGWLTYEAPSGAFSVDYPEDFEYLALDAGDLGEVGAGLSPDDAEAVMFADEGTQRK